MVTTLPAETIGVVNGLPNTDIGPSTSLSLTTRAVETDVSGNIIPLVAVITPASQVTVTVTPTTSSTVLTMVSLPTSVTPSPALATTWLSSSESTPAPTQSAASARAQTASDNGVSPTTLAAVLVPILLVLLGMPFLLWLFWRRRQRRQRQVRETASGKVRSRGKRNGSFDTLARFVEIDGVEVQAEIDGIERQELPVIERWERWMRDKRQMCR